MVASGSPASRAPSSSDWSMATLARGSAACWGSAAAEGRSTSAGCAADCAVAGWTTPGAAAGEPGAPGETPAADCPKTRELAGPSRCGTARVEDGGL
eukprot:7394653-Lingulodinium_polyedra.AAC.1